MFKKKWQQPLLFPLKVKGKVWDRQEAGPHHIGKFPNKGVRNQVHYTQNNNTRLPSDVAKGSMINLTLYMFPSPPGTGTYKVGYGIAHNAGKNEYDPTLNLTATDTAPIGPS